VFAVELLRERGPGLGNKEEEFFCINCSLYICLANAYSFCFSFLYAENAEIPQNPRICKQIVIKNACLNVIGFGLV